jgi:hypothetical protein
VQQQRGTSPGEVAAGESPVAESNADAAAVHAVGNQLGFGGAMRGAWQAVSAPLALQRCPKHGDPTKKKIQLYEDRIKDLDAIDADTASTFSELAASHAERTAIDHWLAVLRGGSGSQTGSISGEAGDLPKCNCTTYVADVLEWTFNKVGRSKDWKKVYKKALALNPKGMSGLNGMELQQALMDVLGWKAIFFARDPEYKHYRKRKRDASNNPVYVNGVLQWEPLKEMEERYPTVKKKHKYYGLKVSHSVINYHPEEKIDDGWTPEASTTTKDVTELRKLETIPIGVLTARGALHMALIVYGVVYEVHWDATSSDIDLYQSKALENWGWEGGLIVAPADDVDAAFGK